MAATAYSDRLSETKEFTVSPGVDKVYIKIPNLEAHLVSFGNYLFDRYDVKVFSDDGQNVPMYTRQVTDADLSNWQIGESVQSKLPSAHQIGAKVSLSFGSEGILKNCEVIKVHFSESKVLYDIEVKGIYDAGNGKGNTWSTRLYNVDSAFVTAL